MSKIKTWQVDRFDNPIEFADVSEISGRKVLDVSDLSTSELLGYIFKELQKVNLHLEAITDNHFIGKDTE